MTVSPAVPEWINLTCLEQRSIASGRPAQNTLAELFNCNVRDEHVNEVVFSNMAEARTVTVPSSSTVKNAPADWIGSGEPSDGQAIDGGVDVRRRQRVAACLGAAGRWRAKALPAI